MRFLEKLYQINLVVTPGLLFLETFTPPNFLERKISVPYLYLLCASLLLHFFLLCVINVTKQVLISRYLFWSAVSTSVVLVAMYLGEKYIYPNFVFSSISLHPEYFRFLTLYFLLACLLVFFTYLRHKPQKMIWIFPFYFYLILCSVYFSFEQFFIILGLEDGIIESLTSIFFLCSSGLAIYLATRFSSTKKIIAGMFLILAVGCFVIAGEEISWGQRLFSFQSPDYFLEENVQQETTLHNLKPFQDKMTLGYIIVGVLGTVGPYILPQLLPKQFKQLSPPRYISVYFLPMLLYGCLKMIFGPFQHKTWEEFMELIFSSGVFIYLMSLFLKTKKSHTNVSKV